MGGVAHDSRMIDDPGVSDRMVLKSPHLHVPKHRRPHLRTGKLKLDVSFMKPRSQAAPNLLYVSGAIRLRPTLMTTADQRGGVAPERKARLSDASDEVRYGRAEGGEWQKG
jgi:hypothetical protein